MAADFDRFAWLKPTFLPVVAAGNAGAGDVGAAAAALGSAVGTVSSPAVAKNCLAVAAALTEPFDGSPEREDVARERVPGELLVAAVSGGAAGANQAQRGHRAVAAVFSPAVGGSASSSGEIGVGTVAGLPPLTALASSASGDWALVAADPLDACSPLKNGNASVSTYPSAAGAVIFAWRGRCSFSTKAANAAAAGAAALLIANTGPGGALRMTGSSPSISTALAPTASVSKSSGDDLAAALAVAPSQRQRLRVSFSRDLLRLPTQSDAPFGSVAFSSLQSSSSVSPSTLPAFFPLPRGESMAYFSSGGPTPDGRFKPDLAAPGTTVSAFSDGDPSTGNCGGGMDRGTSMATPVVAGAALLARQYFTEGWWWGGSGSGFSSSSLLSSRPSANSSAGFEPTSALLRAVLLGGATPMRGLAPAPPSSSSSCSASDAAFDGLPLEPVSFEKMRFFFKKSVLSSCSHSLSLPPPSNSFPSSSQHQPPSARQGHGRLHLGRSLPLDSSTSAAAYSSWGMVFADNVTVSEGSVVRFCLDSSAAISTPSGFQPPSPLVVTLAWTDRPPSPAAASALVNDLDLEVTLPGGGATLLGNGGAVRDSANNAERVFAADAFFGSPPAASLGGSISIAVRGRSLPLGGTQAFALTVHGAAAAARIRAGLSPRLAPTASAADCASAPRLPPAITRGPPPLGNASTVSFAFETPSLSNVSSSTPTATNATTTTNTTDALFECRLAAARTGSTSPPPLFAWTRCSSPVELRSLPDGGYTFSVRNYVAAGGGSSSSGSGSGSGSSSSGVTSASFAVDTVAPVAEIFAEEAPMSSARRGAVFAFRAAAGEASAVSFECMLQRQAGNAATAATATAATNGTTTNGTTANGTTTTTTDPVVLLGASSLGAWEPCSSPKGFGGLGTGTWVFSVGARDAAGNEQRLNSTSSSSSASWTVRLPRHAKLVRAERAEEGTDSGGDGAAAPSPSPGNATAKYSVTFSFEADPGDDAAVAAAAAGGVALPPAPALIPSNSSSPKSSVSPFATTDVFECSLSAWNSSTASYSTVVSPL